MQELAQVLAKVKRLILDNEETTARQLVLETLERHFSLAGPELISKTPVDLNRWIRDKKFGAEQLNMLAYYLDELASTQHGMDERISVYRKVLLIYNILEEEYSFVSFAHITRKSTLLEIIRKPHE